MKVVIKLGGSVLTNKDVEDFPTNVNEIRARTEEFVRTDVVESLVDEIVYVLKKEEIDLVLINGAGPFGHYLVKEFLTNRNLQLNSVLESVEILNSFLVQKFKQRGKEVASIRPFYTCKFNGSLCLEKLWSMTTHALHKGKIVSTHGDIIPSTIKTNLGNYSIISGDDLVVEISKLWKPEKVVVVTDVDGVFTNDPKLYDDVDLIPVVKPETMKYIKFGNPRVDVTGGMESKVKKLFELAKLGIEPRIISGMKKNNITKVVLENKPVGTLIRL